MATDPSGLAEVFELHRPRLRGLAYRLLGSLADADDAVQEAWLRLSRSDTESVHNPAAWLTTVVSRLCLNMLRTRRNRREDLAGHRFPDPVIVEDSSGPQDHVELAESVSLALLVVLETLNPAERVAFVLHDVFAVPFDEIAPLLDRSVAGARQLASRARRRVKDATPTPDPDLGRQRAVVEAFMAAARGGDLASLMATLDPDVILVANRAGGDVDRRGAQAVADSALMFSRPEATNVRLVRVNGAIGALSIRDGRAFSLLTFVVRRDRIARIDVLADPDRLTELGLGS